MDDETTGRLPDEDDELTRVTPPDDATRVMPAAGEGETQVMPRADAGADTGATRVMPAAGQAPPPPPSQPTLLMTHGRPSSDRGVPWWVWLLVVLAVVAVAAALWYFYLRPTDATTAGEEFIGHWSPQSGNGGGLVIKQSGEQFQITQYDDQLEKVGTTTADLVDDQLQLSVQASAIGLQGVTGAVQGTLTHESAQDLLRLQFAAGDVTIEPVYFVRVDTLLPGVPSPTPSPTASPTPTASPSPTITATPSPSATGSPTADQEAVANIARLQVGIVAWAADNNNLYPPPQDVVEGGGLSQYVTPWPANPFTGEPMAPGTAPGDYVYEQLSGGQAYKLTGYLSNGLTYAVP
ncbi:MAG TPA: hypothetical protein VFZ86_14635 [Thermoleophilia bacterium]|nr:hypothetical protein [Thermoleophilia bacterium]